MSCIRSKDTKPEKIVRSLLHRTGYRFRLHVKNLRGTPDIVLPKYKTVIFVHGCFWHRHPKCKFAYRPKSRVVFWEKKLSGNVVRDKKTQKALSRFGWQVIVVWECETTKPDKLINRLSKLLLKQIKK